MTSLPLDIQSGDTTTTGNLVWFTGLTAITGNTSPGGKIQDKCINIPFLKQKPLAIIHTGRTGRNGARMQDEKVSGQGRNV